MVKIIHSPIQQIVIHEMVEYSLSDFVKHLTLGIDSGASSNSVKWCDGIIFAHVSLPSTADVVKDQMNGIVHWAWFSFADMPSYKDSLQSPNKAIIPIINVSNNDLNKELIRWIKKNRIGA